MLRSQKALSCYLLALAGLILVPNISFGQDIAKEAMPLSNTPSASDYAVPKPLSFAQQQARYSAEQATLRMEWNKWHGYLPARPNTNGSFMYTGLYNFHSGVNYAVTYNPMAYVSPRWYHRW